MRYLFFIFTIFLLCQNNSYAATNVPVKSQDFEVVSLDSASLTTMPHMAGNPYSWWNRWGKQTAAFTGTFLVGVGAGVGIGSAVAGIGIPSGAIIGAVAGFLGAVAVVRAMPKPGE